MQNSTLLNLGPLSWILLALLLLAAAAVWRYLLGRSMLEILLAGVRALLQLAVVALLISQLSSHPLLALAFIALMFVIAVWTSGRRISKHGRWWMAALPIAAAVLPVALLMFFSGVLPWNALALIAIIGQQIGGAMATTTLAGRRIEAELLGRRGEVEAAVALGFTWPAARRFVSKEVAGEAVVPSIDQARTAGTVTLPGAFVGLILGGASPLEAGQIQLLVLISLLLVNGLAAWVCLLLSNRQAWMSRDTAQIA
ncbi:putative ABC transport system permease protein [Psychromicrobium silvestre]|uniref:Putative ABC transport system permease protein n=1 Tax=Psychromicrobium silvestre TaxID=1645614 RepID=A0A7Y9LR97_9MICC|nr:ABC transporter permease [Psychromicrobium silvestre]NYE94134.1 putative ABC transport system permease protein [Psychromicrobium silvestre]